MANLETGDLTIYYNKKADIQNRIEVERNKQQEQITIQKNKLFKDKAVLNNQENNLLQEISKIKNQIETDDIKICIYSSRSKDPILLAAMKDYLLKYINIYLDREMALNLMVSDNGEDFNKINKSQEIMSKISFPTEKPPAWLTIDDRAVCFKGTFPTYDEITKFQPWNTKGIKE